MKNRSVLSARLTAAAGVLMTGMLLGLLSGIALGVTGCASSSLKEENPRMGLLDRLARLHPANHRDSHEEARRPAVIEAKNLPTQQLKDVSLKWPLRDVRITSPFGQRGREFHEGIDLHASAGTPVYAAHNGKVIYADTRIHGYGRMIVLKHASGIATIYAHNSKLLVHPGQWVSQGTLLAYSGNTGHSTGPHLHFEIRNGSEALNPLKFLPKPAYASRDDKSAQLVAESK